MENLQTDEIDEIRVDGEAEIKIEDDAAEIPISEYEAMKIVAAGIAEQNALVLQSIVTLRDELVAQAETITTIFGAFRDAMAGLGVTVNVPDIVVPSPVVNVAVPEPRVVIQPNTARKVATVKRGKQGEITSIVLELAK